MLVTIRKRSESVNIYSKKFSQIIFDRFTYHGDRAAKCSMIYGNEFAAKSREKDLWSYVFPMTM